MGVVTASNNFAPKKHDTALVIVTLNEGARLLRQLREIAALAAEVDVIVADGESSDGLTDPATLRELGVHALVPVHELGLGHATAAGYSFALAQGYRSVITMDANGKDGVEALPSFVRALGEGFDLVQGSRFMRGGIHRHTPLLRLLGIKLLVVPLMWAGSRRYYSDPTNAFRGCSARFLGDPRVAPCRAELRYFSLHFYLNYRAARLGFRTIEIPVRREYPEHGPVPTKITSLAKHLAVVRDLVVTVCGYHNPR